MKKLVIIAGAAVGLAALGACGVEKAAEIVHTDPTAATDALVEEGATGTQGPQSTGAAAGLQPVGTTANVADWDITVTHVAKDADDLIRRANQFNDRPEGQFVLVTYRATYRGDARKADADMDLAWSFTDSAQVSHDEASVVTPGEDGDSPSAARRGGTVTLDVAFDIEPDEIQDGLITVEGYDELFDSVYADFTL